MTNFEAQVKAIVIDPAASYWLKIAIAESLRRDIVDAVNDVEVLLNVLKERLRELMGDAGQALATSQESSVLP